jgi:predicted RNase H-like HicB family nuclease
MGGKKMFRFPIVIEKGDENYSAFSPDLPGCGAAGLSIEDVLENMRSAILFHINGLKEEGLAIPEPATEIEYIEISV